MKKKQDQRLRNLEIEDDWNIEDDDDYEAPVYENDDEVFVDYTRIETVAINPTRKRSSKK